MIFWLLVIVALIAGAVWLVRSASHHDAGPSRGRSRSSSLEILEERTRAVKSTDNIWKNDMTWAATVAYRKRPAF